MIFIHYFASKHLFPIKPSELQLPFVSSHLLVYSFVTVHSVPVTFFYIHIESFKNICCFYIFEVFYSLLQKKWMQNASLNKIAKIPISVYFHRVWNLSTTSWTNCTTNAIIVYSSCIVNYITFDNLVNYFYAKSTKKVKFQSFSFITIVILHNFFCQYV